MMVHRAVTRIGVALLLVSGMLFCVQGILIPYQEKDATSHNQPRGNLSDLYPRWLGARELLLHGRDPYSPEITREIQAGYYGRPLEAGRPGEPSDQQAFAYPVYVVFLLAPTVGLQFSVVQTAFFWFLLALTTTSVALWLMLMNWRPARSTAAALTLLTLGSFAVIQGLKLQQLTLLVSGLIALSAALLSRGYLFLAGVLMAFVTIKPQLAIPIAGWFLIWALSNWKSRSRYVAGFGVTSMLFLAASQWLLPGWIARFRDGVVAYRSYTGGGGSVLDTAHHSGAGKTARGVDSAGHRISMLEIAEGVATSSGICLDHSARAHGHRRRYSDDSAVQPRLVTSWNHDPGAAIAPVVEKRPR